MKWLIVAHLFLQSGRRRRLMMMDAEHSDLRASPDDAIRVTTPADAGQQRLTATYGLRALATVVFDIDSGQKLDALYPPTCGLSEAAKTSLAHLALPHSNNQDEGDTQFTVRFRDASDESVALSDLLFGFVLFRQQKDASRTRGYFQKALVLVSAKPYVDLYDRVLRVIGPLFFTAGPQALDAVYNNINAWYEALLLSTDGVVVFRSLC
ncbi:hypothetical protein BBJ28_00003095 [Nothophytophthora sp. Chile5]|nr:hypothetical protein BBJ28_00003095 [Nothophytophthora sp. Chile5]